LESHPHGYRGFSGYVELQDGQKHETSDKEETSRQMVF
jgi:hypothetical protein